MLSCDTAAGVQLQGFGKAEAQNDAKFATIVTALKVYKEIHGTTTVPQSFVVPDEAPWPPETHGEHWRWQTSFALVRLRLLLAAYHCHHCTKALSVRY